VARGIMAPTLAVSDRMRKREFERECEQLRPLGEAYVGKRFAGQLNHADAQDVVADVVVQLDRKFTQGTCYPNLRAAFFKSVTNRAIDYVRSNGTRPTVPYEEALDGAAGLELGPEEMAERGRERELVHEALLRVPRHYRQALYLRFGVGLTAPAIAEQREMSVPAAKDLLLRATRKLRERFMAIAGGEHCEEMRELARRELLDKYLTDLGSEEELAIVHKHLNHCGACSGFVSRLHEHLHEVASGALVSSAVGDQLTDKAGLLDHVARWAASAGDTSHAALEKARMASFKTSGALQGGEAASGGALVGTGQKIAAVCATGAAAASCVGAGVVGPGVGGVDVVGGEKPPAVAEEEVRPADGELPDSASATQEPQAPAEPANSSAQPAEPQPKPSQQVNEELGFEQPVPSSPSGGGGGGEFGGPSGGGGASGAGSGGGGRENFGF
jgi:RNA polymerase sigma factor (sigma-70 family)